MRFRGISLLSFTVLQFFQLLYRQNKNITFFFKKANGDHVIGKCTFNKRERKDFRSAEKITTVASNKEKTSFWPKDDFSS
jgi:hypothetical protein